MTVVRPLTLALLAALLAPAPAAAQPVYQLVGCTSSGDGFPSSTSQMVDINVVTGAATNPRDSGILFLGGIAAAPAQGSLLGLATFASTGVPNSIVSISLETGASTLIGSTGLSLIVEGDLAFNPADGHYYGVQEATTTALHRSLFRLNPTTGAAAVVGDLPYPGDYSGMAFTSAGDLFVITSTDHSNDLLLKVNPNNGAVLTTTAMNIKLGSAIGMAIHPVTGAAFVGGGGATSPNPFLHSLDLSSGNASVIGPLGYTAGISGLAYVVVPEPNGLVLLLGGIVSTLVTRRCMSSATTM